MSGAASPRSTDRSEAPLPDALGLLVREMLTGQAPPAKARAVVNLWRPWIEGRAQDRARPHAASCCSTRRRSARLTRELLAALNLADQLDQRDDDEKSPTRDREPTTTRPKAEEETPTARQRAEFRPPIRAPIRRR